MNIYFRFLLCVLFCIFLVSGFQAFGAILLKTTAPSLRSATIQLAAVDNEGTGVLIPLIVELKPGTGKILMNIDNPSFIVDTQDSMRTAVREAARITSYDLSTTDLLFSLKTNISIVGGPSAGAAMTVASVSVILDKPLNGSVAITGTIEEGGAVGQIGGVLEKAQAAKKAGIALFLVPKGQSIAEEEIEKCAEKAGNGWHQKQCYIDTEEKNVAEETGVNVIEVASIDDALKYILIK